LVKDAVVLDIWAEGLEGRNAVFLPMGLCPGVWLGANTICPENEEAFTLGRLLKPEAEIASFRRAGCPVQLQETHAKRREICSELALFWALGEAALSARLAPEAGEPKISWG
jgi:hypothetical protein